MQTANQLESVLGGSTLFVAIAALLGACAIIVAVGNAVKIIREWKKPSEDQISTIKEYIKNDKNRLDGHEARLVALETDMSDSRKERRVLMRGVMALLDHELHNGNASQMQEASKEINDYLTNK